MAKPVTTADLIAAYRSIDDRLAHCSVELAKCAEQLNAHESNRTPMDAGALQVLITNVDAYSKAVTLADCANATASAEDFLKLFVVDPASTIKARAERAMAAIRSPAATPSPAVSMSLQSSNGQSRVSVQTPVPQSRPAQQTLPGLSDPFALYGDSGDPRSEYNKPPHLESKRATNRFPVLSASADADALRRTPSRDEASKAATHDAMRMISDLIAAQPDRSQSAASPLTTARLIVVQQKPNEIDFSKLGVDASKVVYASKLSDLPSVGSDAQVIAEGYLRALVQVTHDAAVVVIDPLAIPPLDEILYNELGKALDRSLPSGAGSNTRFIIAAKSPSVWQAISKEMRSAVSANKNYEVAASAASSISRSAPGLSLLTTAGSDKKRA